MGSEKIEMKLPKITDILTMKKAKTIANPAIRIKEALASQALGPSLDGVIADKLGKNPEARAVIVISDNTRPVPYTGERGILWPIAEKLIASGVPAGRIMVLVATGTHRPVTEAELRQMLDPRVFEAGIAVKNHDCDNLAELVDLGKTSRGSEVLINRHYMEADLKIITGLVESHFMAGASGGRKAVCPGLVGRKTTYIFHGAPMLASNQAKDLVLEGNPCHEEALEVALTAGVDYMVNVTLDHEFNLTGIFAGDLQIAHQRAVETIREYVTIPLEKEYDLVVTHAGFVGINHYQAAKAAVVAIPALKQGGSLIIAANTSDWDHVGSLAYRTNLQLLKLIGPENYNRLLLSPDWTFIPDQWQVQMWARVLEKISQQNLVYYSAAMPGADYQILPGVDGNNYLPEDLRYQNRLDLIPRVVEQAVSEKMEHIQSTENRSASIAYLADGPYGVPAAACVR